MDQWFLGLLAKLRVEAKNDVELSRRLGLKSSNHIPEYLAGQMTPGVEPCLLLATETGEHPSKVLRAAGHERVIPVLESTYRGTAHTIVVPAEDATLCAAFHRAIPEIQRVVRAALGVADVPVRNPKRAS